MSKHVNSLITVSDSSPFGKVLNRCVPKKSRATAKKKYDYIGNSYLDWSIKYAFDGNKPCEELYKFCNYIGVSFKHCTRAQYNDAVKKYASIAPYPNKDCIVETDEYIAVKLK